MTPIQCRVWIETTTGDADREVEVFGEYHPGEVNPYVIKKVIDVNTKQDITGQYDTEDEEKIIEALRENKDFEDDTEDGDEEI
jgi:hypothetical protein